MIGFIAVTLRRGQLVNREQLRGMVANLFPEAAPKEFEHRTSSVQRYIDDLPSVYTCIPRNASRASFLWQDTQAFEVVVEATIEGNLIATIEAIVRQLIGKLKQVGVDAEIRIVLKGSADWRVYLEGEPISKAAHIWRRLKPNIVAIGIAVIVAIIAKIWLKDYYPESIASIIALSLFALYTLYSVLGETVQGGVHWTVNARAE
jgi:hypothetical protein